MDSRPKFTIGSTVRPSAFWLWEPRQDSRLLISQFIPLKGRKKTNLIVKFFLTKDKKHQIA